MDAHDPLAGLKDIHLPPSIGWWPLAPGWYLLIILSIVLIFLVLFLLYKYNQRGKTKKAALILLKSIRKSHEEQPDSQKDTAAVAELLKRVALAYYPRQTVASLHGNQWIAFLENTGNHVDFKAIDTMLLELPFKPHEPVDIRPLFEQAEVWIKQRRKPHV